MKTGLSVGQAQSVVLAEARPLGPEVVATRDALGRVLAEPVDASRTLPPADNSAMDGFAVRADDVRDAAPERPVELPIAFEVAAGAQSQRPLGPGEAARIFTGAPLPDGADAVVRQEDADWNQERVRILLAAPPRANVRDAGEDVRAGDRVLDAGVPIRAAEIGMLAALGRTVLAVHQRPRVAILSSGDELVEPDASVHGGRIVSSNSYSLAAQCREVGADPVYLGIARDTREDIERRLRAGRLSDVLVSSAGVSVGDRDHMREVLEKLGCTLAFWGVQMKPGYPVAFGRFAEQGPLVFALPGNPVSAMVTFEQFVRPALRKLAGHRTLFRPTLRARLTHALTKSAGRLHFVRVALERRDGEVLASSTGSQSSGVLLSMNRAHGLLVFPADATEIAAGATASVQVLDPEFFMSDASGLE
ncbi:MAG: molybdopterin molybdotransferase MoeA [Deltaproteobacteria bacterium]|nr:MAG: molybdopterin molybdotransferase MoeA [Deltaproteobacteria bacterium]